MRPAWNIEIREIGMWFSVDVVYEESLAFILASMYAEKHGENAVRILDPNNNEL